MADQLELLGLHKGVVVDNRVQEDLAKKGQLTIKVAGLMGNIPINGVQAIGGLMAGDDDYGSLIIPKIGSKVVVGFFGGDPDAAFWFGGWHGSENGGDAPDPVKGKEDASMGPPKGFLTTTYETAGNILFQIVDPGTSSNPTYGKTHALFKSETGHEFVFEDTPDGGRISLYHANGAEIELRPGGGRSDRCNIYHMGVIGAYNKQIGGNYSMSVGGLSQETYNSGHESSIRGNAKYSFGGTIDLEIDGRVTADFGNNLEIKSNSGVGIEALGNVAVFSGSTMTFGVGGQKNDIVGENSQELIANNLASPDAKVINAVSGNIKINTDLGNLNLRGFDINLESYGVSSTSILLSSPSGGVTIQSLSSSVVVSSDISLFSTNQVEIEAASGPVSIDSGTSINVTASAGNILLTASSDATISSQILNLSGSSNASLTSNGTIVINAPGILIGPAPVPVATQAALVAVEARLKALELLFSGHFHVIAPLVGGPTSPAPFLASPPSLLPGTQTLIT